MDLSGGTVVAVSGGIDSVVLLHALKRLGGKLAIAHCNFGLRGDESNDDELFVRNLGDQLELPVFVIRFDTLEIANREHKSIQHAARDLRYEWLESMRKELNYRFIATAHHANDNAETVLQHIVQGTGLAGLRGIPAGNNRIIRPLLFVTKEEIKHYANEHAIKHRTDSSNQSTDYLRNKIRLELVPLLESINPSVINTLNQNARRWTQAHEIFHQAVKALTKKLVKVESGAARVNIASLLTHEAAETLLYELLKEYGFNAAQASDVFHSLQTEAGKVFYSETHRVIKDRNHLVISLKHEPTFYHVVETKNITLELPHAKLHIEAINNSPDINLSNKRYQYIDADNLVFPLIIRPWRRGDYFYPFGLNKKKKLSDFFTDNKLSLRDKEQQPLVQSGDYIVALPGLSVDHRFRVKPSTKAVLKIFLVNGE